MFYLAVVQGHAWYPERSQPASRDPDLPRSKGEFIRRAGR